MKCSVIDIGSNSVRLLLWADGKTLYKKLCTTRLGEGLSKSGVLTGEAITRTANAVARFCEEAKTEGAERIFAFATAAVRRAFNGSRFVAAVKEICGLDVDVLSGEREAEIGFLGALGGNDGGVLDIGGASTEILVGQSGRILYAKSLDIGAVRLKDLCGEDKGKLLTVIDEKISPFASVPQCPMFAIGGTATTLVSLHKKMKVYEPSAVHDSVLTQEEVRALADKLLSCTQDERLAMDGMEKGRADVIGGGALLMSRVMEKIGARQITVSERDNLEGYLIGKKERGEL